jgi:hypothetical protein
MTQGWKKPFWWSWQEAWFNFKWRFRRAIRWALRDLPVILLLMCPPIAGLLVVAVKYKVGLESLHHVTGILAEITTVFAGIAAMRFFAREYHKEWRTNNQWFDYGEKDEERTRWRQDPDLQVHFVTNPQRGFVITYDGAPIGWSDDLPDTDPRAKSQPAISLETAWARAIELYRSTKVRRTE